MEIKVGDKIYYMDEELWNKQREWLKKEKWLVISFLNYEI